VVPIAHWSYPRSMRYLEQNTLNNPPEIVKDIHESLGFLPGFSGILSQISVVVGELGISEI
jgi:hypothetical protein